MKQTIMAIDIGSINVSCVIAEVEDGIPRVIGVGFSPSQGIRKGVITTIDYAARSVKTAIMDARRMSGSDINRAIVSISGVYAKSRNSSGTVSTAGNEIGEKDIYRVIQGASHNANIPAEYEAIHVLPYQFMVDDQDFVDDPKGMSGSRLRAMVHIVTAPKTALENLRRVVKSAGIEIESIVLSSYASSIAVLGQDEKELGVACIDIGGDTCDVMIHSGNSMCYNGTLPVGSNHITKDIAHACNTSPASAEELKIQYANIADFFNKEENTQTLEVSTIGGEKKQTISRSFLAKVIYARLRETFGFLYGMLERSELKPQMGAGIVFTGGLMKMKGINDFIEACFKDFPTRIAIPKEIEGMSEDLKDPACSTVIGLILYGAGNFTNYEMDSEKRLKTQKSKLLQEETREIGLDTDTRSGNEKIDFFKDEVMQGLDLDTQKAQESLGSRFKKLVGKLF